MMDIAGHAIRDTKLCIRTIDNTGYMLVESETVIKDDTQVFDLFYFLQDVNTKTIR